MLERESELTNAKKNESERLLGIKPEMSTMSPTKTMNKRWAKYLFVLLITLIVTGGVKFIAKGEGKGPTEANLVDNFPVYYGPTGSVDQLVFYSHYLSRISGASQISEIKIFSTALANFVRGSSKKMTNYDLSTSKSIVQLLNAYIDQKASENLPNYLGSVFGLVQMEEEDIAEEVPLRHADNPYNTPESIELWRRIQDDLATSDRSKIEHTEFEYEFIRWIERAREGRRVSFSKLAKLLRNIVAADKTSNVLKYSTCSRFKAVGLLFREFQRDTSNHPTASMALRFAAVFETLKLALNLDATDLTFSRFLESLILGWQQHKYLEEQQIQKIITAINSAEKDPSLASSVLEMKKLQMTREEWDSFSRRLW